jgi:hypothetical protein
MSEISTKLQKIAHAYLDALKSRDFQVLRSLMIDNTTFSGPLAKCENADECMEGLKGLASITTDIVIKHIWADDFDVITWYELYTSKTIEPLATCNWMHIENSKISSIKVVFDPRPLLTK